MSKVKFGLWYDFRNPGVSSPPLDGPALSLSKGEGARSFASLYAQTLDQIALAEGLGFDQVW
ncbi:MAG TPA: hypothetical protein VH951_07390, partial [Dehalococcoidia bacterium]